MEYKKIKALISLIIDSCQKEPYGIPLSKLCKILYFIDFGHYAKFDTAISDFDYLRFQFGPVPKGLHDYLALLEEERVIDRRRIPTQYGEHDVFELYPKTEIIDFSFTEREQETIDKTLAEFKRKSGATASRKTHYQSPWITTDQGEIISIELSKYCDFEWLGYFFDDKSENEINEIADNREMFRNDKELQELWGQIQNL